MERLGCRWWAANCSSIYLSRSQERPGGVEILSCLLLYKMRIGLFQASRSWADALLSDAETSWNFGEFQGKETGCDEIAAFLSTLPVFGGESCGSQILTAWPLRRWNRCFPA